MIIRWSVCRTAVTTGGKAQSQGKSHKAGLNRNHFKKIYVHRIYSLGPGLHTRTIHLRFKYNLIYRPLPVPLFPIKY